MAASPATPDQPPFGGTEYWSNVMRKYLDEMTRVQPPIQPQPLDNSQVAAFMLNPSMRPQLMEMYHEPMRAAIANSRSRDEMLGRAVGGAGHMLAAAGEYEQRAAEDRRRKDAQDYQTAHSAALNGDVNFDFSRFPELASLAHTKAVQFGTIHAPEDRVTRQDRLRKEWGGHLDKLRGDIDKVREQRIQLGLNPNFQSLSSLLVGQDEDAKKYAKTQIGDLADARQSLVEQEGQLKGEYEFVAHLSTAMGPHGEPSPYENFINLSDPERRKIMDEFARAQARKSSQGDVVRGPLASP